MTANLNVARASDGVSSPDNYLSRSDRTTGAVRPRRERTDEDREWHSEQAKVQIQIVHCREVGGLSWLAYYGRLLQSGRSECYAAQCDHGT